MSGDLVSLRLLLVGARDDTAGLWRSAASRVHIPVDFDATTSSSAKVVLSQGGVDICVLDGAMEPAAIASVVKAVRRQTPATLVFASLPSGVTRPDNIDGVVPVPADATEADRLVGLCIRAKMRTQVLLAADSESLRSIVRKILGACRFELDVHETTGMDDTLARLSGSGFGLVFLDQNMAPSEWRRHHARDQAGLSRSAHRCHVIRRNAGRHGRPACAGGDGSSEKAVLSGRRRRGARTLFWPYGSQLTDVG